MVLGVDEATPLQVEVVGKQGGIAMVKIKDEENNDMAELLVESGLALTDAALTYGELSSGPLLVFAAASPTDLHLSSPELFKVFSDEVRLGDIGSHCGQVYPGVQAAGAGGEVPEQPAVGQRLLAHSRGSCKRIWNVGVSVSEVRVARPEEEGRRLAPPRFPAA